MPPTLVPARRLTVYVKASEQWHGRPLYSAVVQLCLSRGLAGASVVQCVEGYGSHHQLHTARIFSLSDDLPVRIEVIDRPEAIDALLEAMDGMLGHGLATLDDVRVVLPAGASVSAK
jgi:PII-like signaling protein